MVQVGLTTHFVKIVFIVRLTYINFACFAALLQALQVEQGCREMATCEIGAYVLHQNRLLSPILIKIFKTLFSRTSNLWIPIRRGFKGEQCHKIYPACRKEFLMKR